MSGILQTRLWVPAAGGGGSSAYALVAATANYNVTSGINTTGANLIVIVCFGNASTTPSDSNSNTWTGLTAQSGSTVTCRIWYCYNPVVGSGHTFTRAGSAFNGLAVAAFSGAASSPFDAENGTSDFDGDGSTAPGSVSPSVNNELVIAGIAFGGNTTYSGINSSYTTAASLNSVSGVNYGGALAYLIQGTAASTNPSFTYTVGSTDVAACIASFKST